MTTAAALAERPGHPREALARLCAGVDAAATAPWWRCSDDEVAGAVADLDRQAARLDAARLRLLTEADQRDVAAAAGATSTAQWYAHTTTSRRQHAGHRVALARSMNGPLAETGSVLATGAITGDHAAVVHRVMTALPAALDHETRARAEHFLLEQALTHDPAQLAVLGTALRRAVTDDDGHGADREETRAIEAEGVTLVRDDDGRWHLRGVLAPESGARLHTALDALSAPGSAHAGARDGRPACQRRAQALTYLADTWLSGHPGDGPSASDPGTSGSDDPRERPGRHVRELPGSARPHLTLTVPIATALAPREAGATPALLEGGFPLSPATLATLECDAVVTPILVDEAGSPLDVGQRLYAFSPRIRAAITYRDRHCTFRGCERPPGWCQVHHLVSHASGGPTSERNLPCGYHHRHVHRHGWRGEVSDTRVLWHPPQRGDPHVPPPPWAGALRALIDDWHGRWAVPEVPAA